MTVMQCYLPTCVPCMVRKASEADAWEKALTAFEKELRLQLHKVNLLCLLAQGMFLSQQCNDPTLQCILMSMLAAGPQELLSDQLLGHSNIKLLKFVKWFGENVTHLAEAVGREFREEPLGTVSKPRGTVSKPSHR